MLFDSHAHLDIFEDLDEVIKRAKDEGVEDIITVGVDLESSIKAIEIAKRYEGVFAAVGFHPHNARYAETEKLEFLIKKAEKEEKVIGWGEIGLDFYKNYSPRDIQIKVFKEQLHIAKKLSLPVIIHDREAHEEVLSIIKEIGINKGVIHCFSGDSSLAKKFIEQGFFISIPGTVTYRKASKIRRVVSEIDIDHMLVETDCPFLTPYQKKGTRNEPAFIRFTVQEIASIKGMSFEEVAKITTKNTKGLFRI